MRLKSHQNCNLPQLEPADWLPGQPKIFCNGKKGQNLMMERNRAIESVVAKKLHFHTHPYIQLPIKKACSVLGNSWFNT